MGLNDRIKHAWNAFASPQQSGKVDLFGTSAADYGPTYAGNYGIRPDRLKIRRGNEKSIIPAIYNRMAIDISSVAIMHVKLDANKRFVEEVDSGLNYCLTTEANIDQAARAFMQDAAMTLFEKGTIAIVPVITDADPTNSNAYDVKSLRVGEIVEWHPQKVTVSLYDDRIGKTKNVTLPKSLVAIVENPLYTVMNEANSNLQRLTRKIGLLDAIDEQTGSGKLDLIIQLPYVIKSEARRQQAEQRRGDIEDQLKGSRYGIAYTDGTEKVTQLNRPAENNMLAQIEYLTKLLYGQLGITEDVFNGTANEATMLNYHNRTIEPILTAITQAMKRTFLSRNARTRGQSIEFYRDPFKMITLTTVADLGDKLIRNKIMTSNEFRGVLALKPSTDAGADQLNNPNMPEGTDGSAPAASAAQPAGDDQSQMMQSAFDEVEKSLDSVFAEIEADLNA